MTLKEKLHFQVGRWYIGRIEADGILQDQNHFLVIDRSVNEISVIEENDDGFIDMKKVKKYHISINKDYTGEEYFQTERLGGNSFSYAFEIKVNNEWYGIDTEDISSVEFRY